MLLTVNKVNEVLSGVIGDSKYAVPYSSEIHKGLLALEEQFDTAQTPTEAKSVIELAKELVSKGASKQGLAIYADSLKYDAAADKFYLYSKAKDVTSSIALPKVLAKKIVEAVDKDISVTPLIKAWTWFLKNPKFTPAKAEYFAKYITTTYVDQEIKEKYIKDGYTPEKATEFATYQDVAITKNGLLSTYKYAQIKYKVYNEEGKAVSRYEITYDPETGNPTVKLPENAEDYYLIPPVMGEGGDPYFTGETLGHRIIVGQVHAHKEWDKVNCTDGRTGGLGLHLGGRTYIQGYGGGDRLLLNCFVNPMNIGAFTDTGDGAIRVKEYFVHSAKFAPNKAMYHESTYLEHTNAEWASMREEAIAKSNDTIEKLKKGQLELEAL